jgi:hypothetical protein
MARDDRLMPEKSAAWLEAECWSGGTGVPNGYPNNESLERARRRIQCA